MQAYDLWQKYMRAYDFLCNVRSYQQNLENIATACELISGMRVLDAGSGTGNLSCLLKNHGANVLSLDFCEEALRQHRNKDVDATQLRASLEEPLTLPDKSFDVVCCASVLFALSHSGCKLALREFYRVLENGGRLVVTVASPEKRSHGLFGIHYRSCVARHGRLTGFAKVLCDMPRLARIVYYNALLQRLPDWNGYHRFREDELYEFLVEAGFQQVKVQRTFSGCFFLVQAVKQEEQAEPADSRPRTATVACLQALEQTA